MITKTNIKKWRREIELGKCKELTLPRIHCMILGEMLTSGKYSASIHQKYYNSIGTTIKDYTRLKVPLIPKSWVQAQSAVQNLADLGIIELGDKFMRISDDPLITNIGISRASRHSRETYVFLSYNQTKGNWIFDISFTYTPPKMGMPNIYITLHLDSDESLIKTSCWGGMAQQDHFLTPQQIKELYNYSI